jgi:hypothetical protein
MRLRRAITATASAVMLSCSTPSPNATFTESVPDRASFPLVAQALEHRCGMLDCHGTPYRNLRVYGNESLRWSATDRPLQPPCTTSLEADQDFDSVVGLEPEVMSAVVADRGAHPERLTFIRKARGTESHKAGTIMVPGDDLDSCITSWLAGQTDTTACQHGVPPTIPPPSSGQTPPCEPGP